jgi:Acyl-CoA carboxylase epsilon subunit
MAGPGSGSADRQSDSRLGDSRLGDSHLGDGRLSDSRLGDGRAGAPVLAVVRGDASAEEIAALTAVLAAGSAAAARAAAASTAGRGGQAFGWASRRAMLRKPLSHGPGAWRASARPGAGA